MWTKQLLRSVGAVVMISYSCFTCGCSSNRTEGDVVSSTSQAVTDLTPILGFENASDWTANLGIKSLSTTHTQGSFSLAVQASQYTTITSAPLSSLGAAVGPSVSLDFLLPTQQANPSWFGALQLYVTLPSANIYNAYVGQQELTGLPLGTFSHLQFTLPDNLVQALRGSYTDLQFAFGLNVQSGSTGTYLFDNFNIAGLLPQNFDGETLFSGIFFGVGPASSAVSDILSNTGSTADTLSGGDRERLATAVFSETDHEHMYPQWQNQFSESVGVMA